MALSFDNLRIGKKYSLKNYGEVFDFQVVAMPEEGEYQVKDLHTLDKYLLSDLVQYGKGKDFDLWEFGSL
ncbi:hypothetical protein FVR03_17885 [Pontibacter qinzhouensis]|uniref:Uncharacterized protein n=1 Tax=Pontibacter qinzhouensis TaxID=2603253 RepID=A0A5C8JI93_9BACT|nr:hypothetical protein [Pontibacter qinzhouensis]TXK36424.1 hypothetical protein FVR03_17885 [Pontibacter qinzhouensis]